MKKIVALLLFGITSSNFTSFAASFDNQPKFTELSKIIARSILDSGTIIVVAEIRYDSNLLDSSEKVPKIKPDLRWAFDMHEFFPVVYLRGDGNKSSINVQTNKSNLIRQGNYYPYMPNFSFEGTWLLFLKPVEKLPDSIRKADNPELQKKIESISFHSPPHAASLQLGINDWLRKDNWFSLAEPMSAVLIDFSVRDLPYSHEYDELFLQQHANLTSILKQKREKAITVLKTIILTPEQFVEVKSLIGMFNPRNDLPSIEQLIKLNSPFSNAILEELANQSANEMEDRFLQLKNEIPESFSGSAH